MPSYQEHYEYLLQQIARSFGVPRKLLFNEQTQSYSAETIHGLTTRQQFKLLLQSVSNPASASASIPGRCNPDNTPAE